MLIILDGPDGAGKTTLATQIVKYLRDLNPESTVDLLHAGPPNPNVDPIDEYVTPLLDYRPVMNHHIVCDRWHWGERVYPKILKRESKLDNARWAYIENFLVSRGAYVAHVSASPFVLANRLSERGDDLISPSQAHEMVIEFDAVYNKSIVRRLNVNVQNQDDNVLTLVRRAEQYEAMATKLNGFTTYVGTAYRPSILFLGDTRGPGFNELHTAFMPYSMTSGHYLWRTLSYYPEWTINIGVANACDVDNLSRLLRITNPKHVVALGRNATNALNDLKYEHQHVAHPQYVRRFQHSNIQAYHNQLFTRKVSS